MSEVPTGPVSVEHAGLNITSVGTGRSSEQIKEEFEERDKALAAKEAEEKGEPPEKTEEEKTAEAAAELGKKGGKASAKAKKKAEKEAKKAAETEEAEEEPEEEDEGEAARKKVAKEIEDAPPHEKKKLASERVAEATREASAAKRKIAQLEKELDAIRRAPSEPPPPAPDRTKYEGKEPEYVADLVQHKVQEALAAERERQSRAALQARQESFQQAKAEWIGEREQRFIQSRDAMLAKDPDAAERISDDIGNTPPHYMLEEGEQPEMRNYVMTEVMDSKDPMGLVLYLSDHPEEFQRIAALQTPREVARAMAIVEHRLSASNGTPAQTAKVSKAPPPVQPLTGAPHSVEKGYQQGMSLDEYARVWKP